MAEVTEKYKAQIRACPIDVRPGGASENNRNIVFVDWRPVLAPNQPDAPLSAYEYQLGFDPTLDVPSEQEKWVDAELRYAPAPVWTRSEAYIQFLEEALRRTQSPAAQPIKSKK